MQFDVFQDLLLFFNNQLEINILVYESCFSGEIKDIYTFSKYLTPYKLHFPIVFAGFRMTPNASCRLSVANQGYKKFSKFFAAIKTPPTKDEPFYKKLSYIIQLFHSDGTLSRHFIKNLPSIRYPGKEWSSIININKYVQKITKTLGCIDI